MQKKTIINLWKMKSEISISQEGFVVGMIDAAAVTPDQFI